MLVGAARCTALGPFFAWAREHDGPTGFQDIACPVQILYPTEDRIFPRRRYGAALEKAVPQAETHDLPGAGHGATWDAPGLVAERILAFTGRAAPADPG
jgi:pimeloyl-ACP methyl ester carboxylesterase